MIKKWAAKLLHALGWYFIGSACITLIFFITLIPIVSALPELVNSSVLSPSIGGSIRSNHMIFVWIAFALYAIVVALTAAIPGALLVIFYGRKNVELTTQYQNPKSSWTDKLDFKVLALWILFASSLLWMPYSFGIIHTLAKVGLIADPKISYIVLSVSLLFIATLCFGIAKLAPWAWWGIIVYVIFSIVVSYIFFHNFDLDLERAVNHLGFTEYLENDGGSEDPREILEFVEIVVTKFARCGFMTGFVVLIAIAGIAIWLRKEFFKPAEPGTL